MTRLMLVIDTDKRVDCPYREQFIHDDQVFYKCRAMGFMCDGWLNQRHVDCPLIPVVKEINSLLEEK